MSHAAGTYDEWRVTGWPGDGYDTYEFVWSERLNPHLLVAGSAEAQARAFVTVIRSHVASGQISWRDGPHLGRRAVTIGEWEEVTE